MRRFSTPERIIQLQTPDGRPVTGIAAYAVRYFVTEENPDAPDGVQQLFTFGTASGEITIESAAAGTIRIAVPFQRTVYTEGERRGILTWREDGTDPVWPVIPDDFQDCPFEIVGPGELTP